MTYVNRMKLIFVFLVTFIFKRNKKIIVFGSWFGKRYADNSRYLFEHYHKENKNKRELIWISNSQEIIERVRGFGFKSYKNNSLIGIYYQVRAGTYIYDQSMNDIDPIYSIGAININLWHGVPLKKIGYYYLEKNNSENNIDKLKKYGLDIYKNHKDLVLSTSQDTDDIIRKAFGKDIIKGIYPRVSYLKEYQSECITREELNLLHEIKSRGKKIIFYVPTFRDNKELLFLGCSSDCELKSFLSYLDKNGYLLLTKMHIKEDMHLINNSNIIVNIDSSYDINEFLKITDILITDYSSVYFDFLFLDKEIIFFPYDINYYVNDDRGLILNYKDVTPGQTVLNLQELKVALEAITNDQIDYSKERHLLREKYFEHSSVNELIIKIDQIIERHKA